jgi:hypothetical protein
VIQRNAITSWTRLSPRPEIILFGNEDGTPEIARELGVDYVGDVRRNEFGTPLLDDLFTKARAMARNDIMCYANADMLFLGGFMESVQQLASWRDQFLMVGRRTKLNLDQPVDFESPDWETRLRALVTKQGILGRPYAIDYFVFTRSLEFEMPPFPIGRPEWDNWLLWKVRSLKVAVVDASQVVVAIHQNHDYAHHPQGEAGVRFGEEAMRNRKLVREKKRKYGVHDATHKLTRKGIEWNATHLFAPSARLVQAWWAGAERGMMPVCHRLGIRKERLARLASLVTGRRITWK